MSSYIFLCSKENNRAPLHTYVIFCVDEYVVEFEDDRVGSLVGWWQHVREKLGTRGLRKCLKIRGKWNNSYAIFFLSYSYLFEVHNLVPCSVQVSQDYILCKINYIMVIK